jgi:septal ring factor EnvC (AmiA/AmiB activator)
MTNPDPLARLSALEAAVANAGPRIAALEAGFAQAGPRITQVEQTLTAAIEQVTPLAGRVDQLSAAAVSFNDRLGAMETALTEWAEQNPANDEQLAAGLARIEALETRLTIVEQTRARGGRLSNRLASIEEKLDTIIGGEVEN